MRLGRGLFVPFVAVVGPMTSSDVPPPVPFAPGPDVDAQAAKQLLRQRARALRDALPESVRQAAAQTISAHVLSLLPRLAGRTDRFGRRSRGIGLYSALGSEVDTRSLQVALTRQCYPFALPRVISGAPAYGLSFAMVDARTPLSVSPLGIAEPDSDLAQDAGCHHRLLALFVPCLAYSPQGGRLGYGRGYYDRLLGHFGGHVIGLAYASQKTNELICEPHDVALHGIVTENGLEVPPHSPLRLLEGVS